LPKKNSNGSSNGNSNGNGSRLNTTNNKNYIKCSPTAKTDEQKQVLRSFSENDITFVYGPPGSGKSFLATMWALSEFSKGKYEKIIITRPAVEAYGEKLGFLPGDADEKLAPYMYPIVSFILEAITEEFLQKLLREKSIMTIPLAFQRGINFKNSIVIGDEFQNTIPKQMRMFLTRLQLDSKIIVTGDLNQSDLPDENGLKDAIGRFKNVSGIGVCELTEESIVRHPIIKEIEKRYIEPPSP